MVILYDPGACGSVVTEVADVCLIQRVVVVCCCLLCVLSLSAEHTTNGLIQRVVVCCVLVCCVLCVVLLCFLCVCRTHNEQSDSACCCVA